MAKQPPLSDITDVLNSATTHNANNDLIQSSFNNTLSRDGSTPNQMESDLDLNNNDVLNVKRIEAESFELNGQNMSNSGSSVFTWQGPWTTATAYTVDQVVSSNANSYICVTAHTSGTFATDLASGYWEVMASGYDGTDLTVSGDLVVTQDTELQGTLDLSGISNGSTVRSDLLLGSTVSSHSSNYTALLADRSKVFDFTASATLSLTAAATLGDGWYCHVNATSGTVTIDPNASETVNGATTHTVQQGTSGMLVCDGTNFLFIHQEPYYAEYHDVTNAASWSIQGTKLECWGFVITSASVGATINYPKTFARNPIVSLTCNQASNIAFAQTTALGTSTTTVFANVGGLGAVTTVLWRAVGEWDGVS